MALKKATKHPWWQIKALSNNSAEIYLYDEIDEYFGMNARDFVRDLKSLGDVSNLTVRINSPGGSVFQGIAIYNALKRHPAHVSVIIDGVALSMASGIAMAGDTVTMAENGLFMLHDAVAFAEGDAEDMRQRAELLDKVSESLVSAYADKSGKDVDEVRDLMRVGTWMSAEEAFSNGFIDAIGEENKVAASFDVDGLNVPSRLRGCFNSLLTEPKQMAKSTDPAGATAAASLQELEVIEPNDSQFIVDCLRESATIDAAKDKLIANLRARDADSQTLIADLQLKNARPDQLAHGTSAAKQGNAQLPNTADPAPAAPAATPPVSQQQSQTPGPPSDPPTTQQQSDPVGNQPLATRQTSADPSASIYGHDPVAFQTQAMNEEREALKARNGGRPVEVAKVLAAVRRKYPALQQAVANHYENR